MDESQELVSVLVPLRNEERNVAGLIESLKKISYKQIEIILMDDQSSDETHSLLHKSIEEDARFTVMKGKHLERGWIGKVHACQQLSKQAAGRYLLFLDADVRVEADIVQKSIFLLKKFDSNLLTGFARFPVSPFLAKLLVPMQHFFVFFHLPNVISNYTCKPSFTAAHGGFLFFERGAYDAIAGHASVKNSLLDDVHIARAMKKRGFKVTIANITESVTCHMYHSNREVWNGFLKNIYIGLGRSPSLVLFISLFYGIFYFLPLPLAFGGLVYGTWMWLVPLLLVSLQTICIDLAARQEKSHFLLITIAVPVFISLMFSSMLKSIKGQGYEWKGRIYK
ncbi:glycosyltransferase [Falsibacillus albus]|uniref:Glycosyltransferase n=2 Tax=Falsibacillus albus TaxID=2478915 RepID=A0A3L7JZY0_9BACI|nr:glycosyltransferase [Falsibacillus albus]